MAIFHFSKFEHEPLWRYFKRLSAFLARCGYCLTKWEILDIIDEGVNSETRISLGYWDFHGKTVEDACYLLEWIAWDSFEFEKASHACRYSVSIPCTFYCRSYYALFWCDLYSSSDHATNSCSYYACCTQPYFASLIDNTEIVPTLNGLSFPLASCMGLGEGDPFGFDARPDVADACFNWEDILDEVHDLDKTPLEGWRDVFMQEKSHSLGCDYAFPNPLDHYHVSLTCSNPLFPPSIL